MFALNRRELGFGCCGERDVGKEDTAMVVTTLAMKSRGPSLSNKIKIKKKSGLQFWYKKLAFLPSFPIFVYIYISSSLYTILLLYLWICGKFFLSRTFHSRYKFNLRNKVMQIIFSSIQSFHKKKKKDGGNGEKRNEESQENRNKKA